MEASTLQPQDEGVYQRKNRGLTQFDLNIHNDLSKITLTFAGDRDLELFTPSDIGMARDALGVLKESLNSVKFLSAFMELPYVIHGNRVCNVSGSLYPHVLGSKIVNPFKLIN